MEIILFVIMQKNKKIWRGFFASRIIKFDHFNKILFAWSPFVSMCLTKNLVKEKMPTLSKYPVYLIYIVSLHPSLPLTDLVIMYVLIRTGQRQLSHINDHLLESNKHHKSFYSRIN